MVIALIVRPRGARACATPIIESRVTSAASSSSRETVGADAAGAGSRGSGCSAVESTTRSSTPSSSSTPNSREDAARVGDGARAVGQALVPLGRRAEQRLRVARAERADDEVMDASVFSSAEGRRATGRRRGRARRRRRARILDEPPLELGVEPGARDEPRAVRRRARDEPVDRAGGVAARSRTPFSTRSSSSARARAAASGSLPFPIGSCGRGRGRGSRLLQPVLEDVGV